MASRPLCEIEGCDNPEHYACGLRAKGIAVSPKLMSTRTLNMEPTRVDPPAYNRQLMYDERPGGIKMPLINEFGRQIRRKEYEDKRTTIDGIRRKLHHHATRTKD